MRTARVILRNDDGSAVFPADFQRPYGVEDADRVRLSTAEGNARLIADQRRDLTAKDQIIDGLQSDLRAQASIIAELQQAPTMTVVREFLSGNTSLVDVITTGEMLEMLGHAVGVRWHRDERGIIDGLTLAVAA